MTDGLPTAAHTVTATQLATLEALTTVYDRDGRATYRTVATELGCGVASAHARVVSLIVKGLAAQWMGRHGTLRPTHRIVASIETWT